jgi:hypothetical protein
MIYLAYFPKTTKEFYHFFETEANGIKFLIKIRRPNGYQYTKMPKIQPIWVLGEFLTCPVCQSKVGVWSAALFPIR